MPRNYHHHHHQRRRRHHRHPDGFRFSCGCIGRGLASDRDYHCRACSKRVRQETLDEIHNYWDPRLEERLHGAEIAKAEYKRRKHDPGCSMKEVDHSHTLMCEAELLVESAQDGIKEEEELARKEYETWWAGPWGHRDDR